MNIISFRFFLTILLLSRPIQADSHFVVSNDTRIPMPITMIRKDAVDTTDMNVSTQAFSHKADEFVDQIISYAQDSDVKKDEEHSRFLQRYLTLLGRIDMHGGYSARSRHQLCQAHRMWDQLTARGMASGILNDKKTKVMHELLAHALFIKIARIMTPQINRQALYYIGVIERQIEFWEYQLHHPTYYFFHKMPFKWISKENQLNEVQENLLYLRMIRAHFFKAIGSLSRQLSIFNASMTRQQQRAWINEYVALTYRFFDDRDLLHVDRMSLESLFFVMMAYVQGINDFSHKMNRQLAMTVPPSHVIRHWISYLSGATVLAACLVYFHRNKDKVAQVLNQAQASITKTYQDIVRGPLLKIKEAILGSNGAPKEADIQEKLADVRRYVHGQIESNKKQNPDALRTSLIADYRKLIHQYHVVYCTLHLPRVDLPPRLITPPEDQTSAAQFYRLTIEQREAAAQNLDVEVLYKMLSACARHWSIAEINMQITRFFNPTTVVPGGDKMDLMNGIVPIMLLYAQVNKMALHQAADAGIGVVDILLNKVDTLFTQNRGTFALAALFPAGLVSYGAWLTGKKAVKTILPQPYDYKPLRAAFYTAARVLNRYDVRTDDHDNITDEHLGELLYSLYILKNEARKLTENDRWEFTEDVKQLASPTVSVRQKLRLIEIMLYRFAFLAQVSIDAGQR